MAGLSLKERQFKLKKEYIIEIAKEIFFEKGYENTSIDDISLKAQMSKSTFYTYIKSKEELFMHIHIEGMGKRLEILRESMRKVNSGYDKIYTFGKEYYSFYKANPGFFKLHLYEDYNSLDKEKIGLELYNSFDQLLEEIICLVKEAFTTGMKDKSIHSHIEVGYLDKYFAYTLRTIINVAFNPEKTKQIKEGFNEEKFFYQYLDFFMSSLKNC